MKALLVKLSKCLFKVCHSCFILVSISLFRTGFVDPVVNNNLASTTVLLTTHSAAGVACIAASATATASRSRNSEGSLQQLDSEASSLKFISGFLGSTSFVYSPCSELKQYRNASCVDLYVTVSGFRTNIPV